jgi:hypothetical protein
MPAIAFWNFNGNADGDIISEIWGEIFVLAEQGFTSSELMAGFSKKTGIPLYSLGFGHQIARVHFYSRFPADRFVNVTDTRFLSGRETKRKFDGGVFGVH